MRRPVTRGPRHLAGSDDGFTLIELIVAMAMAIPVLFALSMILVVTLHQTQRTYTRVNATSAARNAMATVENELHSACVGQNTDPILPGSTPTSMSFLSYTGTDDTPTPVWHMLALVANPGSSPASYRLVDTSYGVTASSQAVNIGWVQGSQIGSPVTLLSNVTPLSGSGAFQYYDYKPYQNGGVYDWIIPDGTNLQPGTTSTYPVSPLSAPANGGLAATDASNAVEVKIALLVGADNTSGTNSSLSGTSDPITDSVSLRLTTPANSSTSTTDTGDFGPCA